METPYEVKKPVIKGQILYLHLLEVLRMVKIIETSKRRVVARGWGGGRNGKLMFIGYRVSVWEDKKVLELDGGEGGPTV